MTGKELKKIRLEAGLTQDQMAKKYGYTSQHWNAIENGREKITKRLSKIVKGPMK